MGRPRLSPAECVAALVLALSLLVGLIPASLASAPRRTLSARAREFRPVPEHITPFAACQEKIDSLLAKFRHLDVFLVSDYEQNSNHQSSGHFGTVRLYTEKKSGARLAIKQMLCNYADDFTAMLNFLIVLNNVSGEIEILREITEQRVPFVTALHGAYQDPQTLGVYIAMQELRGRNLKDLLFDHNGRGVLRLDRRSIAIIVVHLAVALSRLHSLHIVHKDIKCDNIFIDYFININQQTGYPEHYAKSATLIDFGLSEKLKRENNYMSKHAYGVGRFYSPERTTHTAALQYGTPVDIWALGLVMYAAIVGNEVTPFDHFCDYSCMNQPNHNPQEVETYNIRYTKPYYSNTVFTPNEADLLSRMLDKDPSTRITAHAMLEHPYFLENGITGNDMKKLLSGISPFFPDPPYPLSGGFPAPISPPPPASSAWQPPAIIQSVPNSPGLPPVPVAGFSPPPPTSSASDNNTAASSGQPAWWSGQPAPSTGATSSLAIHAASAALVGKKVLPPPPPPKKHQKTKPSPLSQPSTEPSPPQATTELPIRGRLTRRLTKSHTTLPAETDTEASDQYTRRTQPSRRTSSTTTSRRHRNV